MKNLRYLVETNIKIINNFVFYIYILLRACKLIYNFYLGRDN